jgi:hypothetical protein
LLGVLILPLPKILLMDFGTVPKTWYFCFQFINISKQSYFHMCNEFSVISWREQVTFDQMRMMSAWNYTNTLSKTRSSALRHIIVIPSEPILALAT